MLKFLLFFGIILLFAIGITQWFAHKRDRDANEKFPPLGQLIDVDGVKIHVAVKGDHGSDLVLIHGASGNLREFAFDLADRLAKSHRVFMVDRPGMGHSDLAGPEYGKVFSTKSASISKQASLIKNAVQKAGAEKPIVIGHSYGGAVALAWGVRFPDELGGIVALGAASNPWVTNLGLYYDINGSLLGGAIGPPIVSAFAPTSKVLKTMDEIFEPQQTPKGYAEYVGAELVLRRHSLRANARQVQALLGEIEELSPRYGEIKVPVKIIHGDLDTIVPLRIHSQKLVNQVQNGELNVLKGVGHMPHHSHPEIVLKAVQDIISLQSAE